MPMEQLGKLLNRSVDGAMFWGNNALFEKKVPQNLRTTKKSYYFCGSIALSNDSRFYKKYIIKALSIHQK